MTELPYSREMEAEADAIGLMIAASGCFDPEAASDFWARLSKADGEDEVADASSIADINRSHPTSIRRARALDKLKPMAQAISIDCGCPASDSSKKMRKKLIQMIRSK